MYFSPHILLYVNNIVVLPNISFNAVGLPFHIINGTSSFISIMAIFLQLYIEFGIYHISPFHLALNCIVVHAILRNMRFDLFLHCLMN